jgi:hypothetical protein
MAVVGQLQPMPATIAIGSSAPIPAVRRGIIEPPESIRNGHLSIV